MHGNVLLNRLKQNGCPKYTWVTNNILGWPTQLKSMCGKHIFLSINNTAKEESSSHSHSAIPPAFQPLTPTAHAQLYNLYTRRTDHRASGCCQRLCSILCAKSCHARHTRTQYKSLWQASKRYQPSRVTVLDQAEAVFQHISLSKKYVKDYLGFMFVCEMSYVLSSCDAVTLTKNWNVLESFFEIYHSWAANYVIFCCKTSSTVC